MLKMLKFDFYKIFKSKALLSVFIVTMCISVLDPVIYAAIYVKIYYPFLEDLRQFVFMDFLIWIFVVPFVSKDFSSKYIKNVYSSYSFADKIYYILSKIIYIFVICLIWFALRFFSHLMLNLIQSAVFKADFMFESIDSSGYIRVSASEGMFLYFCQIMNFFARGMLCMFLCMLLKKEYFVLLVVLPYWFTLSDILYGAINGLIAGDSGRRVIEQFTIFGIDSLVSSYGVKDYVLRYTQSVLVSLGYSAVFAVSSWLCFFKRSY